MSRKLLLADDSVTIQKVIGITFVNEDYTLAVADNGDAALEKAKSDRPDLILADVFMPGKNGYELCAAVKADPSLAGVPVLLLTGTFEPFDEAKAESCGADGWIAKPFESQTLITRVKELLDKAWAPPPAPASVAVEEPAPVVPAGEPVSAPEPEPQVEADIWTELEEPESMPAAAAVAPETLAEVDFSTIFSDDAEAAATPTPTPEAAEDIWGEVSLVEEDLASTGDEPILPAAADEVGGKMEASAETVAVETAISEEPVGSAEAEEVLELGEDDILVLDDEDILEPEAAEDDFVFVSDTETFATEGAEECPPLAEDIFAFEDEEPAAPAAEGAEAFPEMTTEIAPLPAFFESPPVVEDEALFVSGEEFEAELPPAEEDLEPQAPIAAAESVVEMPAAFPAAVGDELPPLAADDLAAAVSAEAVAQRAQILSEAELEQIVERVAKTVIERLAGTILERIAWEVVPDLAESLIKEELRQIRAEAEEVG